jgi:putative membrane protein
MSRVRDAQVMYAERSLRFRIANRLLILWLGNCLGLAIAAALLPAVSYGNDLGTLLAAGAILGLVNFALRPIVILMTLPAVILSLGGALLLVNALMLWLTSVLVPDLNVGGFWSTLAAAIVIWLVNMALRPWRRARRRVEEGPRVRVEMWR